MKDIEEFVKDFVDIKLQEPEKEFGYWPFHMFVEKEDGHVDIICIAEVPDGVKSIYTLIGAYLMGGVKRIYCAVDYPAALDMKNDFVAIFHFRDLDNEANDFSIFGIPYNKNDGTVYERIEDCELFTHIVKYMYVVIAEHYKEAYKNEP